MQDKQPDIIILMTDQWNPRCLGYEGAPGIRTPTIDELAREGMAFSAAYTVSPVCQPARGSFSSALYPHNHHFWSNYTGRKFPTHELTMFRDLGDAGYRTGWIGKMHFFNHEFGSHYNDNKEYYDRLGLDYALELPTPYMGPMLRNEYTEHLKERGLLKDYIRDIAHRFEKGDLDTVGPSPLPPDDHPDGYIGRKSVEYIEHWPTDKPMFLCVSFPGPHTPFDAPGKYARMFDPQDMELDPNVPNEIVERVQIAQANYYGKLTHLDDRMRDIIMALKDRGNWENTLVLFTADHGECLGRHNKWAKGNFMEESVRIPLVMRWPEKIPAGVKTNALVELIDIYPTLVEVAKGKMSPHRFGQSLLPILTGKTENIHDAVFSEIGTKSGTTDFMVRTPDYKWFVRHGKEALFHMRNDPFEMNDLIEAPEHRERITQMKMRLLEFLRETQINYSANYKNLFTRMGFFGDDKVGMAEKLEKLFLDLHYGNQKEAIKRLRKMELDEVNSP